MALRVLIVAAALVLALGAAGCGNDVEEEGGGATATEAATGGETEEATTEEEADTGDAGGGSGDAENGAEIFASAGCGGCHTLAAANSSGTTGPNLDELQPEFDAVVAQVTNGGGGMPPFKDQLSEQEINDVAAYVSENAGS
jgi:cytochrome c551